ncbi:hypothetical protein ACR3GG_003060, partial [Shigella sonnei]
RQPERSRGPRPSGRGGCQQWSLRPWRKDARPRWMGAFRPRPQDGYSPVVRDYDTGLPTQGVKVEEKKQKF